ncbi:MAG: hypothetical protein K0S05_3321, partial [Agromyces sp.]|nr:hypothetical protein [Agromyces sp.]
MIPTAAAIVASSPTVQLRMIETISSSLSGRPSICSFRRAAVASSSAGASRRRSSCSVMKPSNSRATAD